MSSNIPPTLDRRSGLDRRGLGVTAPGADSTGLDAALAPPFTIGPALEQARLRDPWATVAARGLANYRDRRLDDLTRCWNERLVWHVVGSWPGSDQTTLEGLFDYHRRLRADTNGTFRQEVVAVDASGGPIVVAHLRTTARRGDQVLDTPTLLTFELVGMRVHRVTEIPGDRADWESFWGD
jgi:hypothetical protein